jgi:hypothetical protein
VDDAGAVFGRGVVGEVNGREAPVAFVRFGQRMMEAQAVERLALGRGEDSSAQAVALKAFLDQRAGEQQQPALGVDQRVVELGVEVERLVGRQGPGRGGPDDRERVLVEARQPEGRGQLVRLGSEEGHVHRRRSLVRVLDLELGQRGAAVETPVHRLQAAIDEAALDQPLERADLAGLVAEVHGPVRMLPVAEHAQALEVGHLLGDLLGGVGAAPGLHLVAAQLAPVGLLDLVLDRQAVAVPARHVHGIEAGQLARLDDHVLEHLVDRMADVQLAVRVRRPVVQHELRPADARIAQALVGALLLPLLHPRRLALGQIAAHREGRVGQVERGAVVGRFGRGHGQSRGRDRRSG